MSGHGYAYRCGVCDGDPLWQVVRIGDVAVSWACAADLSAVCDRLQRDFEVTELRVTLLPKLREVNDINRMIREAMPSAGGTPNA